MAFSCYLSKLLSVHTLIISEQHIIGQCVACSLKVFKACFSIAFIGEVEVLLQPS